MKTVLCTLIALGMLATPALADQNFNRAQAVSQAGSQSASGSLANVAITNNGASKVRTTGAAVAPGLASSGISCSNSGSLGAGWMGGALAIGLPIRDRECDIRENAKIMGIIGGRVAAKETMCDIPRLAAVFARIGQPCVSSARVATRTTAMRAVAYGAPRARVQVASIRPDRPVNCRNSTSKYCK